MMMQYNRQSFSNVARR